MSVGGGAATPPLLPATIYLWSDISFRQLEGMDLGMYELNQLDAIINRTRESFNRSRISDITINPAQVVGNVDRAGIRCCLGFIREVEIVNIHQCVVRSVLDISTEIKVHLHDVVEVGDIVDVLDITRLV